MQEMRSLRSLVIGLSTLLAAAPAVARAQQDAPKGWLGVLITTGIGQRDESGRWMFSDYPVIESIDPGSPAEKAGLLAGDILISINKQDFKREPIPMASLLVPGQRVVFTYKRNDEVKTSRMTVADRPAGTSATVQVSIIGPAPTPRERARTEEILRTSRVSVPVSAGVSIAPLVFATGTPSIAIAGAELTILNEDLRQLLKVSRDGLFVVNVVIPSPAGEAGLRSGDVIIRAGDHVLQDPGQLITMMRQAQDRMMRLQIVRKQKAQNIVLRW